MTDPGEPEVVAESVDAAGALHEPPFVSRRQAHWWQNTQTLLILVAILALIATVASTVDRVSSAATDRKALAASEEGLRQAEETKAELRNQVITLQHQVAAADTVAACRAAFTADLSVRQGRVVVAQVAAQTALARLLQAAVAQAGPAEIHTLDDATNTASANASAAAGAFQKATQQRDAWEAQPIFPCPANGT